MTELKNDRLHGIHVHEVEVRSDLGEVSTLRGTFQDHRLKLSDPREAPHSCHFCHSRHFGPESMLHAFSKAGEPVIPVIFVIPVISDWRPRLTDLGRSERPSFLSFSSFLSFGLCSTSRV